MKKKVVISIIGFFLVGMVILFVSHNKTQQKNRSDDYIAIIYHSETLGMDAGTEYSYYIYKISDNEYDYVKKRSTITIKGSSEEEEIASGKLKEKNDFSKIEKDIQKDKQANSQSRITYTHINNGIKEECKDMEELKNKLFK